MPVSTPGDSLPRRAAICFLLVACSSSTSGQRAATSGGHVAGGGGSANVGGASGTSGAAAAGASERAGAAGAVTSGPAPYNPCGTVPCPLGQWINVTPPKVDVVKNLDCGNFGTSTVGVDPNAPATLYTTFDCQGIFKSTDYGLTWKGPINTGQNGRKLSDAAGAVVVANGGAGKPPLLYAAAIRGSGTGFWVSTNEGVDWSNFSVGPSGNRQDFYAPSVDPYDSTHLLMPGHEMDLLVESTNGGKTWSTIAIAAGMKQGGGTGLIFFIDTGTVQTTRKTWLWVAQQAGGNIGTWRTEDGTTWVKVDKNEHPHGGAQIHQPDLRGTIYMTGAYSDAGWGVLRSQDYGKTWAQVGFKTNLSVVFATKKYLYAMYGWPAGSGVDVDPSLQFVTQSAGASWQKGATPNAMLQGPGHVAVTSDGAHSILVAACYNAGLWRYVEP